MNVKFLDEAQFELDEAIEYYNNESEGLGDRFLREVLTSSPTSVLQTAAKAERKGIPDS